MPLFIYQSNFPACALGITHATAFFVMLVVTALASGNVNAAQSRVFVTSTTHDGNLTDEAGVVAPTSGIDAGNQICNNLATTAGLGGTWFAWLSDTTTNAKDSLPLGAGPFVDVNQNSIIATDINDLLDGTLLAPISLDETGALRGRNVYTGTATNGDLFHHATWTCGDWTNDQRGDYGMFGFSRSTDWEWTGGHNNLAGRGLHCPNAASLYCFEFVMSAFDFGDAPDSYGTTLVATGARHALPRASTVFLGACVDAEADGIPALAFPDPAVGDDNDTGATVLGTCAVPGNDEDGVTVTTLTSGADNDVSVTANDAGFLSIWVDIDADGTFGGAGEQVVIDEALAAGATSVTLTLPPASAGGPTPGDYYIRLRFCSAAGMCNTPTGLAPNGEVEDYLVTVKAPASGGGGSSKKGVNVLGLFRVGATDGFTLMLFSALGLYGLYRRRKH